MRNKIVLVFYVLLSVHVVVVYAASSEFTGQTVSASARIELSSMTLSKSFVRLLSPNINLFEKDENGISALDTFVGTHHRADGVLSSELEEIIKLKMPLLELLGKYDLVLVDLINQLDELVDAALNFFDKEFDEALLERFYSCKQNIAILVGSILELVGNNLGSTGQEGSSGRGSFGRGMAFNKMGEENLFICVSDVLAKTTQRLDAYTKYHSNLMNRPGGLVDFCKKRKHELSSFFEREGNNANIILPVFAGALLVAIGNRAFRWDLAPTLMYVTMIMAAIYILVYIANEYFFEKFDDLQPKRIHLEELRKILKRRAKVLRMLLEFPADAYSKTEASPTKTTRTGSSASGSAIHVVDFDS